MFKKIKEFFSGVTIKVILIDEKEDGTKTEKDYSNIATGIFWAVVCFAILSTILKLLIK